MNEPLSELRRQLQAESTDSLQVLASPADNPICSISYDASINGVVIVWKRYATSTQLRFIHEFMLDVLRANRATTILGDDTGIATIHAEDRLWITQDWLPRAIAAGLRAGASKKPASYFGQLSVSSVQAEAPRGIALSAFENMTEARRWLKTCVA